MEMQAANKESKNWKKIWGYHGLSILKFFTGHIRFHGQPF